MPRILLVALVTVLGVGALVVGFEGTRFLIRKRQEDADAVRLAKPPPAADPVIATPDDPESMSHPENTPGAWTGPSEDAPSDEDEDDGEIPTTCVDARRELETMIAVVSGLTAACTEDAECLAYGDDPRDSCGAPRFTSAKTFRRYRRRHDLLIAAITAACPKTTEPCEEESSTEPACNDGSCGGR